VLNVPRKNVKDVASGQVRNVPTELVRARLLFNDLSKLPQKGVLKQSKLDRWLDEI